MTDQSPYPARQYERMLNAVLFDPWLERISSDHKRHMARIDAALGKTPAQEVRNNGR